MRPAPDACARSLDGVTVGRAKRSSTVLRLRARPAPCGSVASCGSWSIAAAIIRRHDSHDAACSITASRAALSRPSLTYSKSVFSSRHRTAGPL
jgi:hypothetical protein